MMSTPTTRGVAFVTLAMVLMGALGIYGWMQIQHAETGAFLYVFVGLANALGLVWNNLATARVRTQAHTIGTQVAELVEATNGNGDEPKPPMQ